MNKLLEKIYKEVINDERGSLASYIPELARVNPKLFGASICTCDGQLYSIGDVQVKFTLQSVSKAFIYAMALKIFGREELQKTIGVEPTGEAFNSIIELEQDSHRPFNPMINSGAIATSSLIYDLYKSKSLFEVLKYFESFVGTNLNVNEEVFVSEKKTAHRNRAIANLMRHFNVIGSEIEAYLDLYFQQCSIEVNVQELSLMAGTLANAGTQPTNGIQILEPNIVRDVLSLMFTCGMYDTSGEWAFNVGIPAKSGVSGALIAVVPNRLAIAVYSPLINSHGHSIRGLSLVQKLADELSLNIFANGVQR